MPLKLRPSPAVPTAVSHLLEIWGRCIRTQRVAQHVTAADLCSRMDISLSTLRRLERGDPGASASAYLTALWILGVAEAVVPQPDPKYWGADPHARARDPFSDDDEYF